MGRPEYMRVHRRMVPEEIIQHYSLQDLFRDDHILVEIDKGMYGLPQAGRLYTRNLKTFFNRVGMNPSNTHLASSAIKRDQSSLV